MTKWCMFGAFFTRLTLSHRWHWQFSFPVVLSCSRSTLPLECNDVDDSIMDIMVVKTLSIPITSHADELTRNLFRCTYHTHTQSVLNEPIQTRHKWVVFKSISQTEWRKKNYLMWKWKSERYNVNWNCYSMQTTTSNCEYGINIVFHHGIWNARIILDTELRINTNRLPWQQPDLESTLRISAINS